MGIISDIIEKAFNMITDWLRSIFDSLLAGAASVIHWITVKWEEAKFHIGQALANFYNTNVGFWTIFLSIVGFVALSAWLGPKVAAIIQKGLASSWVQTLEKTTAHWVNVLHLNTLVEINRLAQAIFPQWRTLWSGIYQDVGNIMGDIGYGFGTMAAMLTAARSLLVTWNSALGLEKETADTTALLQMGQYLQGLSNRFNRYAENPQDIWNDFYEYVVLPYTGRINDVFGGLVRAIPEIERRLNAIESLPTQFLQFQKTYEERLSLHPPVDVQTFDARLAQASLQLNQQINKYVIGPLNDIQESIGPLVKAEDKHNREIKDLQKQQADNTSSISNLSGLDEFSSFVKQSPNAIAQALLQHAPSIKPDAWNAAWCAQVYALRYSLGIIQEHELPDGMQTIAAEMMNEVYIPPGEQMLEELCPPGSLKSYLQSSGTTLSKPSSKQPSGPSQLSSST